MKEKPRNVALEIRSVLEEHGKVNRFGMDLLHQHFGMKQDEPDFHALFLSSLLSHGYFVLHNAIEPAIAQSLIANFHTNTGYDPRAGTIRKDIGIGIRKMVTDTRRYSLPDLMNGLYEITRPAAIVWARRVGYPVSFPRKYSAFQKRCNKVGQNDPVVVFRYRNGSYVRFHSDPVLEVRFPFQFLGLLSDQETFSGGDFLLRRIVKNTSSRIRLKLRKGDVMVFPVNEFKRSKSAGIEYWQHGVGKVTRSERFSISFLLNQGIGG